MNKPTELQSNAQHLLVSEALVVNSVLDPEQCFSALALEAAIQNSMDRLEQFAKNRFRPMSQADLETLKAGMKEKLTAEQYAIWERKFLPMLNVSS